MWDVEEFEHSTKDLGDDELAKNPVCVCVQCECNNNDGVLMRKENKLEKSKFSKVLSSVLS